MMVPPPFEREAINRLALRYKLPTVYQDKALAVQDGGLMSYGAKMIDMWERSGPQYVDRILRGANPGDLPVEFSARFELVVNLKTARTIGLTVPSALLLRADEVIE